MTKTSPATVCSDKIDKLKINKTVLNITIKTAKKGYYFVKMYFPIP